MTPVVGVRKEESRILSRLIGSPNNDRPEKQVGENAETHGVSILTNSGHRSQPAFPASPMRITGKRPIKVRMPTSVGNHAIPEAGMVILGAREEKSKRPKKATVIPPDIP